MAFCAAATSTIRLIPNVVVLPYRNPFIVAKAGATLDVLSGGRFTLSVGAGYLKSEFAALGVDHAERNELFDEAIDVLRADLDERRRHLRGPATSTPAASPRTRAQRRARRSGSAATRRRPVSAWPNAATGGRRFPRRRNSRRRPAPPGLFTLDDLAVALDDLRAARGRRRPDF